MGVSSLPAFLKYTVHSTVGKSWYSTATQRTTRLVRSSVHVIVCRVRASSICSRACLRAHAGSSSDDGRPPYVKESGGPLLPAVVTNGRSPTQRSFPSARTTFASAQSLWSQEIPSPALPTSSVNDLAPPRSTWTFSPAIPSRIRLERYNRLPRAWTEKTTLPLPPAVCSLLSTPTTAESFRPGEGRWTTTLLTAWQYSPRRYCLPAIFSGRPPRLLRTTGSWFANTSNPIGAGAGPGAAHCCWNH
jgi:hypothetical protein